MRVGRALEKTAPLIHAERRGRARSLLGAAFTTQGANALQQAGRDRFLPPRWMQVQPGAHQSPFY
jgi:hypothetical protein